MKKILYCLLLMFIVCSCGSDFLDNYPKGKWHHGNYNPGDINVEVLTEAKLMEGYGELRKMFNIMPVVAMQNLTTPDAQRGGPPGDGGTDFNQFKPMSYTPYNADISNYYTNNFGVIHKANEALSLAKTIPEESAKRNRYIAECYFLRALMYYRLTQAFGAVPYIDKVMGQQDQAPTQTPVGEIRAKYVDELKWAIDFLPTRLELKTGGNPGRATQNAARAIIAKTYMYEQQWGECLIYTGQIISSSDNDLTTPYAEMFWEKWEYGPESIWEINADEKPNQQIFMSSQWSQVQGVRGTPNLGWGHNAPSKVLMDAYESGDPRKAATVISHGDVLDGITVNAAANGYQFFNKKAYTPLSERQAYGRQDWNNGSWMNIRVIRYADILLMHAEAACQANNTLEAKVKLEMVRARARSENSAILPEVTTDDTQELMDKIRHERRIELALEQERFFDLVRWGIAPYVIQGFTINKHELFPIPQTEIDKSNGALKQNLPGWN